ncbi:MAG: hypothetical protein SGPRY_013309 [Prymnesium sp.]
MSEVQLLSPVAHCLPRVAPPEDDECEAVGSPRAEWSGEGAAAGAEKPLNPSRVLPDQPSTSSLLLSPPHAPPCFSRQPGPSLALEGKQLAGPLSPSVGKRAASARPLTQLEAEQPPSSGVAREMPAPTWCAAAQSGSVACSARRKGVRFGDVQVLHHEVGLDDSKLPSDGLAPVGFVGMKRSSSLERIERDNERLRQAQACIPPMVESIRDHIMDLHAAKANG